MSKRARRSVERTLSTERRRLERDVQRRASSRQRQNARLLRLGLVVVLLVLLGGLLWLRSRSASTSVEERPLLIAQQPLPEAVSGRSFMLADYLGKQDVVVVSYMGFF